MNQLRQFLRKWRALQHSYAFADSIVSSIWYYHSSLSVVGRPSQDDMLAMEVANVQLENFCISRKYEDIAGTPL